VKPRTLRAHRLHRRVPGVRDEDLEAAAAMRPKTRSQCGSERPCPFVTCRHHLYLEVTGTGGLRLLHPGREPWEIGETCSLDVAERGPSQVVAIARLLNLTRERVRQIQNRAVGKLASVQALVTKNMDPPRSEGEDRIALRESPAPLPFRS